MMDNYVNISLDLRMFLDIQVDIRVPRDMTAKDCLQIIVEAYQLSLDICNPSFRVVQTGHVLVSTTNLALLKDGSCLRLETL